VKHGPSALLRLLTRFARTYGADRCYPGQAYLAGRFDVDTRTIRRWTDQLVDQGKLQRQSRGPKSLLYRVISQQVKSNNVRSFVRSNVRSRANYPYINSSSFNAEERRLPSNPVENHHADMWEQLDRFCAENQITIETGADIDQALRLMNQRKPAKSEGLTMVAYAGGKS
jgi:hypothetical protein